MVLVITTEQRFDRTPDGCVWTQGTGAYSFWSRYLEVFDKVQIVARVQNVKHVPADWKASNGQAIEFFPVPYYLGPTQFILRSPSIIRKTYSAVPRNSAVILRVPSALANWIAPILQFRKHPFAVEVVGDPFDVFAADAVRHPFRLFFRWWFTWSQKQQCANAIGAAYVTRESLQKRYPCRAHQVGVSDVELGEILKDSRQHVFATHYSSIELGGIDFVKAERSMPTPQRIRLVTVASLEQLYKAPDVLIQAVAECIRTGLDLELVIVGDGKYRPQLQALVRQLGISDHVQFRGMLPAGEAVRAELDQASLFVLPSRTEGLPRAMIEAMARALPCIGTNVGGIPELLPAEALVPPGSVSALAKKIRAVVSNPQRMIEMSARNLQTAQEYSQPVLHARRIAFYQHVRHYTEQWIEKQTA